MRPDPAPPQWRRRLLFLLPVVGFAALLTFLYLGLTLNPQRIPSALTEKPVPEFTLPPLAGGGDRPGLSSTDLRNGEIHLVNVFASWCLPCRVEHPQLMALASQGEIALHGVNYKDPPDQAVAFLERLGNPYRRIGADAQGRVSIEWGVYGVPESFLIDGQGQIVCKHIGPLSERDLSDKILPLIAQLKAGKRVTC